MESGRPGSSSGTDPVRKDENDRITAQYQKKRFYARVRPEHFSAAHKAVGELKVRARAEKMTLKAFEEEFNLAVQPPPEAAASDSPRNAGATVVSPSLEASAQVPPPAAASSGGSGETVSPTPSLRVSFRGVPFRCRVKGPNAALAHAEKRVLLQQARRERWSIGIFEERFFEMAALHGAELDPAGATVQIKVTTAGGSFSAPRVLPSCEHRAREALKALVVNETAPPLGPEDAKREAAMRKCD